MRLSQKQVTDEFYKRCEDLNIPTHLKERGNVYKSGEKKGQNKKGFLFMQSAYSGIQIQYVCISGGIYSLTSGFIGAREMLDKIYNIELKKQYDYYRKIDLRILEDRKNKN
jgi:hypothetical protein